MYNPCFSSKTWTSSLNFNARAFPGLIFNDLLRSFIASLYWLLTRQTFALFFNVHASFGSIFNDLLKSAKLCKLISGDINKGIDQCKSQISFVYSCAAVDIKSTHYQYQYQYQLKVQNYITNINSKCSSVMYLKCLPTTITISNNHHVCADVSMIML